MGRVEFKSHPIHSNNRNVPPCEPVQALKQVLRRPSSPRKLADQNGVDLPRLCQVKHALINRISSQDWGTLFRVGLCWRIWTELPAGQATDVPHAQDIGKGYPVAKLLI
jgi:hypothetical protein